MNDPGPVGRRQGLEQTVADAGHLGRGEGTAGGHPVGQAAAGEQRHDEDEVVAVVDHVEEADDALVVEPAEDLRLPPDPGPGRGELGLRAVQGDPLEGDAGAVGRHAELDDAHPAPAEAALDDVDTRHAGHRSDVRVRPTRRDPVPGTFTPRTSS